MSAFNEQALVAKLKNLQNTQQSIQTLSHWVLYHRKRSEQSVRIWERELNNAPASQKLAFLYLANDIIQNSKRRGAEFVTAFSPVLLTAIPAVFAEASGSMQGSISRMVSVWDQRRVFPPSWSSKLHQALEEAKSGKAPKASAAPADPRLNPSSLLEPATIKQTPLSHALAALSEVEVENALGLDRAHAIDQHLLDKDQVLDKAKDPAQQKDVVRKLQAALKLCRSVLPKLEHEVERRAEVLELLQQTMAAEEKKMAALGSAMEMCSEKAETLEAVISELKSVVGDAQGDDEEVPSIGPDTSRSPPRDFDDPRNLDMELSNNSPAHEEPAAFAAPHAQPPPPPAHAPPPSLPMSLPMSLSMSLPMSLPMSSANGGALPAHDLPDTAGGGAPVPVLSDLQPLPVFQDMSYGAPYNPYGYAGPYSGLPTPYQPPQPPALPLSMHPPPSMHQPDPKRPRNNPYPY